MNAVPHPGVRGVGGATQNPRDALTDGVAAKPACPTRELPPAAYPVDAMLAALSWHANRAITRQVDVAYALADLARTQAEAMASTVERSWPEGPFREAATTVTNVCIGCAKNAANAATRYGRHFGHLAFAFPRPGR